MRCQGEHHPHEPTCPRSPKAGRRSLPLPSLLCGSGFELCSSSVCCARLSLAWDEDQRMAEAGCGSCVPKHSARGQASVHSLRARAHVGLDAAVHSICKHRQAFGCVCVRSCALGSCMWLALHVLFVGAVCIDRVTLLRTQRGNQLKGQQILCHVPTGRRRALRRPSGWNKQERG